MSRKGNAGVLPVEELVECTTCRVFLRPKIQARQTHSNDRVSKSQCGNSGPGSRLIEYTSATGPSSFGWLYGDTLKDVPIPLDVVLELFCAMPGALPTAFRSIQRGLDRCFSYPG